MAEKVLMKGNEALAEASLVNTINSLSSSFVFPLFVTYS